MSYGYENVVTCLIREKIGPSWTLINRDCRTWGISVNSHPQQVIGTFQIWVRRYTLYNKLKKNVLVLYWFNALCNNLIELEINWNSYREQFHVIKIIIFFCMERRAFCQCWWVYASIIRNAVAWEPYCSIPKYMILRKFASKFETLYFSTLKQRQKNSLKIMFDWVISLKLTFS